MTIEQMLDELIKREGGYVNHPADRGGPTNFGITQQVARAYGYIGDMRSLPIGTAKHIYRTQYWTRPGFDKIAFKMPKLAEELFDTGVNMGPKVASIFLQRAINVLNRGSSDYPDVGSDGDIGPLTLNALDRLAFARGTPQAEAALIRAVDSLQGARYIELAEKKPSQEAFAYGWLQGRLRP